MVERLGAKRGGIDRAVCNASEAWVSVVRHSRLRAEEEGAEPVCVRRRPWKALLVQERALRNPPAYWALNVRTVVVGTRESRLGPVAAGGGKRCPAYNRRTREVALGGRAAVGAGRSTRRSGKPTTWGRARTSSMHGKEQKDSDECRIG